MPSPIPDTRDVPITKSSSRFAYQTRNQTPILAHDAIPMSMPPSIQLTSHTSEALENMRSLLIQQQDDLNELGAQIRRQAEAARRNAADEAGQIRSLKARLQFLRREEAREREERLSAQSEIRSKEAEILLRVLRENHENRMAEIAAHFPSSTRHDASASAGSTRKKTSTSRSFTHTAEPTGRAGPSRPRRA